MPTSYSDGIINAHGVKLTIGGVTYIADDVNVERPTKEINVTDENDLPDRSHSYDDFVTGSANLQFLTQYPAKFETFSYTSNATIGAETFIVMTVGEPKTKGSIHMVPITFKKKYN